ncbi:uncharacterized protein Nmag_1237 [Natrialba magadii ATCC 43099]|uniref:Uncharacterized protein n=1 Tax=Natrialba magadii (strain ATCC 43099 / DSM 3394 / CCM 3739 / CIP 104546 / IAM 13178 / JCM 8861 / NBRC 102185 / NCIMB 2190 / MS3) TaxID=547559 RepID=D3SS93_NATMM|nr:hypothetical protein [Natrialba magadii]ADD04819.1 uncharacterized protein Nmag_1237 [Natrialba magadii ATCC 43099]ELY24486.1 hypothetical protein C500_18700 [Natrialba magadii ATCC 43099]
MIGPFELLLGLVKLAVLVLGGAVSVMAYRAYLRTKIEGLQYFSAGLLVITLGMFLAGVLHHVLGVSSVVGLFIESLLFCVGFLIMIFALYRR